MPYDRNVFFTGRDDILAELHEALQRDGAAGLTQALHGLGGIGKTQTAVEYAYRHEADYSAVFWVRAETADEIQQGYTEIARRLGLLPEEQNTPQNAVPVVQKWLQDKANGCWLLVYDNADTPELLLPYKLRQAQGRILITSRHHNFDALNMEEPIALPLWSPKYALKFLLKRTGRDKNPLSEAEQTAARQVVETLGFFPLALEQAGAYIKAKKTAFSDYRDEYERNHARLLRDAKPVTGDYRGQNETEYRTVWTTWDLNFEAVRKELPAAAEVLTFSAFLAPDPIPGEILLAGSAHIGPETAKFVEEQGQEWTTYNDLLEPLTCYSLIQKESEKHTYTVHRLVQQVLRNRLTPEQQRGHQERVVLALYSATPYIEFTNWPYCEQLLPHWRLGVKIIRQFTLQSDEAAGLLNQMAFYVNERGQHQEAGLLYDEALTIKRKFLPKGHPSIATGLNNLAGFYDLQGRYDEAEILYGEALAIDRAALPKGHPNIATGLNNMAYFYKSQGRYDEAGLLYDEALAIWRKSLPEGHPNIAHGINNLAGLYKSQSRYDEAEALYNEALAIWRKSLSEGHPDIALSLNNLAGFYGLQGRYDEAETLYGESLAILERSLGKNHPNTKLVCENVRIFRKERQQNHQEKQAQDGE